jgi:hypothetical protein
MKIDTESVVEAIFQALGESTDKIEEMSAAGAGAVQGGFQMNREDFLAELKLRKIVKEVIKGHRKQQLSEEKKLRSVIRTLIKESEEDRPHHSTGINVLSDLLKKVVPVIEIDYKKLTSNPVQRQSFRAHMLKAAQTSLDTERVDDEAGKANDPNKGQKSGGPVMHKDSPDAAIDLDIEPQEPEDPEAQKFIDVERPSQKKAKQKEPDPLEKFAIDGEDETGRNIAMSSFQKIEKSIVESYAILSDPEDKRLFYDYLITNLKLYFDKFENELKANVEEPTSQSYEKEKGKQGADPAQGLGTGL